MNNSLRQAQQAVTKLKSDSATGGMTTVDLVLDFTRDEETEGFKYHIPIRCTKKQAIDLERSQQYKNQRIFQD